MRHSKWILALVAALLPSRGETVAWTADGHVYFVTGSAPVTPGQPATVTWEYDPDRAVPGDDESECPGRRLYDFSAPGTIRIAIGSSAWRFDLWGAEIQDNSTCNINNCSDEVGDGAMFSSGLDASFSFASVWLLDCSGAAGLTGSTNIPRVAEDLNRDALTGGVAMLGGSGWACSLLLADFRIVAVNSSTWSDVKTIYR